VSAIVPGIGIARFGGNVNVGGLLAKSTTKKPDFGWDQACIAWLLPGKFRENFKDCEKFNEFPRFDGLQSDVWGSSIVLLIATVGLRTIPGDGSTAAG
jgi:hypothetical protein